MAKRGGGRPPAVAVAHGSGEHALGGSGKPISGVATNLLGHQPATWAPGGRHRWRWRWRGHGGARSAASHGGERARWRRPRNPLRMLQY